LVASCYETPVVAFPGAEGFGAHSLGGRGGRVIEVTNLDDVNSAGEAVPGSLRAAIEASGRRIVVFRVSGTIDVCEGNTPLIIRSPYITIAGQTAPGDGITLRLHPSCDGSALYVWAHDVVIRHVRFRPGPNPDVDGGGSDAITIAGPKARDVIVDHCSFSWATDENVDIAWGASNVTVQWSIVSEALLDAPRAAGGPSGGYGMLVAEGNPYGIRTRDVSIHHNLFAHNYYRNPQVGIDGVVDYRNNVIYDWGLHGLRLQDADGPTRMNIVGNYAVPGPSTSPTAAVREVWALHSLDEPALAYFVRDNIGESRPRASDPELDIIWCREHDGAVPNSGEDCAPQKFARATAFPAMPVGTSSSAAACTDVLVNAGATLPRRDRVDRRIVDQVADGTGGVISSPSQVGGWPSMGSATPPTDADRDGMPNAWEIEHGFDRHDASDGPRDRDGDGFTNVEEFLNGTDPLAPDPWLITGATPG
jgi:pectate lyase